MRGTRNWHGRFSNQSGYVAEPLEQRRLLAGVTLITHGFEGSALDFSHSNWLTALASDIGAKAAADASRTPRDRRHAGEVVTGNRPERVHADALRSRATAQSRSKPYLPRQYRPPHGVLGKSRIAAGASLPQLRSGRSPWNNSGGKNFPYGGRHDAAAANHSGA